MKNADMPAMPISEEDTDRIIDGVEIFTGITKREKFCLKMGVPETGDKDLDDIIHKGNRVKLSGQAMQALIPVYWERYTQEHYGTAEELVKCLMESSVGHADALLKGLDK